ncbi:MAG: hypothetical protein K2L55_01855 [Muribaculaceae bacterium]|nr:hypothetical protein [Muribaculaceae bacterium]
MRFITIKKQAIASVALLALTAVSMSARRPVVKMSVDSSAILMGYTVDLHLTVDDANASDLSKFIIQPDSAATAAGNKTDSGILQLTPGVEVAEGYETPSVTRTTKADGTSLLQSIIKIQSFDSGDYIIPPVLYTNGHDTVLSNSVALRVYPVDTITAQSDLMPLNSVMPPYNRKFIDYLPDWLVDNWLYIVIALVIVAGGICAYLLLTHKVKINILPQKKPEPPYDVAIAKLSRLREEQLCEQGLQKEFYTRLTDILREYLDRRFGINAMEMTSTQIRHALNSSRDEIMSKELVEQVLEIADFVKFAKAKPHGDDNIKAFDAACRFVEDTRPVETDDNAPSSDDGQAKNPNSASGTKTSDVKTGAKGA